MWPEVTLGVDHHLLDQRGAFLEQAAQQVRLAGAAVALDEQAGRQQFLDIDPDRITAGRGTDDD
jgi:hypothetical protein